VFYQGNIARSYKPSVLILLYAPQSPHFQGRFVKLNGILLLAE
jgi:hypothetical protein